MLASPSLARADLCMGWQRITCSGGRAEANPFPTATRTAPYRRWCYFGAGDVKPGTEIGKADQQYPERRSCGLNVALPRAILIQESGGIWSGVLNIGHGRALEF
jgi:hypothetical protein